MPVGDLITLVGAPEGAAVTPSTKFKDLEALVPGFELSSFRDVVREKAPKR